MDRILSSKLMRILLILFICNCLFISLSAQREYYAGINLFAPLTSVPNQYTNLYLPLLSNLENGFAVHGGIKNRKVGYETRLAIGKPNSMSRLMQLHAGINYFLKTKLYIGLYSKFYNHKFSGTETTYFSIIPYFAVGYKFDIVKRLYMDIRLNQPVYAFNWSNLENTRPKGDLYFSIYKEIMPVIPYFSVNIGYTFGAGN